MSTQTEPSVYALLTDGTTVEIRPARPDDFDAVRDMHTKLSPDNYYLRFFGISPVMAEREARRICREPTPDHAALLALRDGEVVGSGPGFNVNVYGVIPAPLLATMFDFFYQPGKLPASLADYLRGLIQERWIIRPKSP